jgi:metal-dependent amidase/aminoacylase/carboxypeptidase family protein
VIVVALIGPQQRQPIDLNARAAAHVKTITAGLVELRRDLHRHPELSNQESRTAGIVAARLRQLGLEVRTGVGGHGVVGILRGGRPGPLVAYRADMDAVRSVEPDPVEFRSVVPGVRHICGHDVHVTIGLGLASTLASLKPDLPGSVMFIFQPAEEIARGASAMVNAGLFAKEKPVAIFGLHTAPHEVGRLSSKAGQMMYANAIAPGVTNDDALFAQSRAALIRTLGAAAFIDLKQPPERFSEDFGAFQALTPGVFFFLGLGQKAMPHSADFVADEAAIPFGIRAMAAVVVARLGR